MLYFQNISVVAASVVFAVCAFLVLMTFGIPVSVGGFSFIGTRNRLKCGFVHSMARAKKSIFSALYELLVRYFGLRTGFGWTFSWDGRGVSTGIMITKVAFGGAAARSGVEAGYRLVSVNGRSVEGSTVDFMKWYREMCKNTESIDCIIRTFDGDDICVSMQKSFFFDLRKNSRGIVEGRSQKVLQQSQPVLRMLGQMIFERRTSVPSLT